jgi:DNA polymerase alpha-associated DNA helicase A
MPQKLKQSLDATEFASNQVALLEKERLAEVAEVSDAITLYSPSQLQARGLALLNLVISSVRTGLGGKTHGLLPYFLTFRLVELERDASTGGTLPSHAIRTGDICRLQPLLSGSAKKKELTEANKSAVEGVISRVREGSITLSLRTDEEIPFTFETRCWLYCYRLHSLMSVLNWLTRLRLNG